MKLKNVAKKLKDKVIIRVVPIYKHRNTLKRKNSLPLNLGGSEENEKDKDHFYQNTLKVPV